MAQRTYTRTLTITVEQEFVVDDEELTDEQIAILDDPRYTDTERSDVLTYFDHDNEEFHPTDLPPTVIRTDNPKES